MSNQENQVLLKQSCPRYTATLGEVKGINSSTKRNLALATSLSHVLLQDRHKQVALMASTPLTRAPSMTSQQLQAKGRSANKDDTIEISGENSGDLRKRRMLRTTLYNFFFPLNFKQRPEIV